MMQVIENRKKEKDYKNIEDQIRCLKVRLYQQEQQHLEQTKGTGAAKQDYRQQRMNMQRQCDDLERLRQELALKYQAQKHEYIRLNNLEGELHAQIGNLRGATSQQMVQNKDLEARIQQEHQTAQHFRAQLQDLDSQLRNEQRIVDQMEQKRRAVEVETTDTEAKVDQTERDIKGHEANIEQLARDNNARREILSQTGDSLQELATMLQDMRHATDRLRQVFWDQEKKIEATRRDLDAAEDQRRQKEKMRDDLRKEKAELEKTLEIKKMELSVEKENEGSIGKHQADLTSRLQELNQEVMILEQKQKAVSFFQRF